VEKGFKKKKIIISETKTPTEEEKYKKKRKESPVANSKKGELLACEKEVPGSTVREGKKINAPKPIREDKRTR